MMRQVTKQQYDDAVALIRAAGNFAGGGPVAESGGDFEDFFLTRDGRKVKAASATYNMPAGGPVFEVEEKVFARMAKLTEL